MDNTLKRPVNRVNHACARCRSRKEKCDGKKPVCSPCDSQGADCTYEELKRRGKAKRPGRVKTLEDRVGMMESLLVRSQSGSQEKTSLSDSTADLHVSSSSQDLNSDTSMEQQQQQQQPEPELAASISSKLASHLEFYNGVKLARNHLESTALTRPLPARRLFIPLQPKAELVDLVGRYLDDINIATFPLFDRRAIESLCRDHFPQSPEDADPSWWAALNTILAIGVQHRAARDAYFASLAELSWAFFRNAFSVLDEVLADGTSLLSLQAVLVMAFFVQGSSADSKLLSVLVSAASRMVRVLGLDTEREGCDAKEGGEREPGRRVFWITYMLDVESSISSGLPLNLDVETEVKLPSGDVVDKLGELDIGGGQTVNHFRLTVQLRVIQARAHHLTRSKSAASTTRREDVLKLLATLDRWRLSLPEGIRPKASADEIEGVLAFPVAKLQLEHFKTLILIYQAYVCWARRAGQDVTECSVEATRVALSLLGHVEVSNMLEIWTILPTVMLAIIVLVDHMIRHPSEAQPDLLLLAAVVKCLRRFQHQGYDIERFISGCDWMVAKARTAASSDVMTDDVQPDTATAGLCDIVDWFLVVEGLLGNLPRPRAVARAAFPDMLQQGLDRPEGILAPDSLLPSTYKMGTFGRPR